MQQKVNFRSLLLLALIALLVGYIVVYGKFFVKQKDRTPITVQEKANAAIKHKWERTFEDDEAPRPVVWFT